MEEKKERAKRKDRIYRPEFCEAIIRYGEQGLLPVQWVGRLNKEFKLKDRPVRYHTMRVWKHHPDFHIPEFAEAWDEAMVACHSNTLDRIESDPVYFNRGRWKLNAYLSVVEKRSIEATTSITADMNVTGSIEIRESFADRPDE